MSVFRPFTIAIIGLLVFVVCALPQDDIRWEKGKCVMESHFVSSAQPGGKLDLEVDALDISVVGTSKMTLIMEEKLIFDVDDAEEAQKYYDKYHVELKQSGKNFSYRAPDSDRHFKGGSLRFQVPEDFNVEISTSGGDLEVENLKGEVDLATSGGDIDITSVTGDVEIATSGGDINLERVDGTIDAATSGGDIGVERCGSRVSVHTSGGDIELLQVTGVISCATSGGDIVLRDLNGEADMATSGGDIDILDVKGNKLVDASTSGGDIHAENIEADLDLSTSSGDIDIINIIGSLDVATANGDVQGDNIAGSAIEAATANGDIVLENIQGELSVATSSGNVVVRMKKSKEFFAIDMVTAKGDIRCYLPDNYKGNVSAKIQKWRKGSMNDISSDFPLDIKTEDSNTRVAVGDINGGGPSIRLETYKGDIEIKKY